MDKLVGREAEKAILHEALQNNEPELLALYGRRRVGKTFLVRQVYAQYMAFECTGIQGVTLKEQLQNFITALQQATGSAIPLAIPPGWPEAFTMLQSYLEPVLKKKTTVIFFDEFPWLHTPKSRFLEYFAHFWNTWASRQPRLKVVICGSAASWMITNVLHNKGSLHNRVTRRLLIAPFTLHETRAYLNSRNITISDYQILQLYMVMGGIPHYLKSVKTGESAMQAIDRECFTANGTLRKEFDLLYHSLFIHAENHITVIRALAEKNMGITRTGLIDKTGIKSGGTATKIFNELEESGFIGSYIPFGKTHRETLYRLTDEYSAFYLRFMEKAKATGSGTWMRLSAMPKWTAWSGYAFESICIKHVATIKQALGISGVYTEQSVWRTAGNNTEEKGAQIDLLLDRADHCINICEIKFSQNEYTITKAYAEALRQKVAAFHEKTKNRKTTFLTMITPYGIVWNNNAIGLVQNEVKIEALFEKG